MPSLFTADTPAPPRGRSYGPGSIGVAVLMALLAAGPLLAQSIDPLVPRGLVRLHYAPSYTTWNSRFGLRDEGGTRIEEEEALAFDLTATDGADLFPGVGLLRDHLASLTGQPGYDPYLGPAFGSVTQEVTRMDMGLQLGVFDWLTIGGTVPLVKNRTAVDAYLQEGAEGADLGFNPFLEGEGQVGALLAALQQAHTAAQERSATVCATGDAAACQGAQALAARALDFWARMDAAYLATPFFPLQGSAMGDALVGALAALDAYLTGAGLGPVGASMALATSTVDSEQWAGLPAGPGYEGAPLRTLDGLWAMGDVELMAHVRILEGEVRDSGAARPRLAFRLSGGALVRLGTGVRDDPDIALDLGSGDGQTDVEGRLDARVRTGRWGLRAGLQYGVQGSTSLIRRVVSHDEIISRGATRRAITWSPGSYLAYELAPRFRVSEGLWLEAGYRKYAKSRDTIEILGDEEPGQLPVDALAFIRESKVTLSEVSFGVRYNTVPGWGDGRVDTPIELAAQLRQATGGSGGWTPKTTRFELSINLFRRLWGASPS